jgi:hypothetical protein
MAIVDRYDAPGGHWNISYPFVRLHGPSSIYGVNSRGMPSDPFAGGLASRNEILDYYDRVMRETLIGSGRVTYLPMHNLDGVETGQPPTARAHSLLTGATVEIVVKRRIVDASYMKIMVPAMGDPGYIVEDGVALVPVNRLTALGGEPERFTVLGAGKTGIDACLWLLGHGVDPGRITWIAPRDAWLINREWEQAADVLPLLKLSECRSADGVADTLEQMGAVMRRVPDVAPSAFRCATVNPQELSQLRKIEDVVRLGRVRHISTTGVQLDAGTIASPPGTVYVDCTADGLTQQPLKPVFDGSAITLQPLLSCLLPVSAALAAKLESFDVDDELRNGLCTPVFNPSSSNDLLSFHSIRLDRLIRWSSSPLLHDWLGTTRLATGLTGLSAIEQIKAPGVQDEAARLASHLDDLVKMAS